MEKDKTTLKSLLLIWCFDHCSKVDYVGEKLETVELNKALAEPLEADRLYKANKRR